MVQQTSHMTMVNLTYYYVWLVTVHCNDKPGDVKCPQLGETDQDLYKNFPLVVPERWPQEVTETVFDMITSGDGWDQTEADTEASHQRPVRGM